LSLPERRRGAPAGAGNPGGTAAAARGCGGRDPNGHGSPFDGLRRRGNRRRGRRNACERAAKGFAVSSRRSLIRISHAGPVATLTLARPAMQNALVPDLLLDLCVALEQ